MTGWRETLVGQRASLRETMRRIEAGSVQIALVVDDHGKLVGTVTDGDIRRGILNGLSLDATAEEVMNRAPTRALIDQDRASLLRLMQGRGIHHMPVVDAGGTVVGLEVIDELLKSASHDNWVVLMAGGMGTRMLPLTDDCPKPMLRIGERPILEYILDSFIGHGYRRFFISVNYLGEMIERYFGDGARWGVRIDYLRENERLGTAGALALLKERPAKPFFVMNADLLTKVNFNHLMDFHCARGLEATMCVREYEYEIPYGVVAVDGHRLEGITEKPTHKCFVSAGIYALSPAVLNRVAPGRHHDMPALFESLIRDRATAAFPVHEYWRDIGRPEDYERAHGELSALFS